VIKPDINSFVKNKKLFFLGSLIAILIAFCDLFTKKLAFRILEQKGALNDEFYIKVTGFFNIVKVWNNGVSFGMFNQAKHSQIIFSVIVATIILILLVWLYKNTKPHLTAALAFIIGGALGNLSDRIHNGAVADFLDFHAFGYHWPAFNLADSFVLIGVVILVFDDLFLNKKQK